mmetsp:Transcript_26855/g.75401  ORF Transcript_26855/g.75401 Transcript_26855/m.75401 type:complete len:340 (-) Transcript_26855:146-1165(-)
MGTVAWMELQARCAVEADVLLHARMVLGRAAHRGLGLAVDAARAFGAFAVHVLRDLLVGPNSVHELKFFRRSRSHDATSWSAFQGALRGLALLEFAVLSFIIVPAEAWHSAGKFIVHVAFPAMHAEMVRIRVAACCNDFCFAVLSRETSAAMRDGIAAIAVRLFVAVAIDESRDALASVMAVMLALFLQAACLVLVIALDSRPSVGAVAVHAVQGELAIGVRMVVEGCSVAERAWGIQRTLQRALVVRRHRRHPRCAKQGKQQHDGGWAGSRRAGSECLHRWLVLLLISVLVLMLMSVILTHTRILAGARHFSLPQRLWQTEMTLFMRSFFVCAVCFVA